jgi:hypothetical protein
VAKQTQRSARIARHTSNRIDGAVALAMALDRIENRPEAGLIGWL